MKDKPKLVSQQTNEKSIYKAMEILSLVSPSLRDSNGAFEHTQDHHACLPLTCVQGH